MGREQIATASDRRGESRPRPALSHTSDDARDDRVPLLLRHTSGDPDIGQDDHPPLEQREEEQDTGSTFRAKYLLLDESGERAQADPVLGDVGVDQTDPERGPNGA